MRTIGKAALGVLLLPTMVSGQLVVNTTLTPEQLVQNVLLGAGVTVSNITFNGAAGTILNDQVAAFDGTNTNIGIGNGLLMCSGTATVAVGPNNSGSLSLGPADPIFNPDPDLEQIVGQGLTNDDAVLEFDFVPAGDSLAFRFVFGSEEYNEFVCSQFNDVFGFFLSGPGINGPFSNNAVNLALVPGTTVPIAINTVNNGTSGSSGDPANCFAADPNWQNNNIYFVDNTGGASIQFDGFTTVITAWSYVQCGQPYHIKLAIADVFDGAWDSGVFIEGGSFTSPGSFDLEIITASADGTLTEGCDEAVLTITRPSDQGDLDITVVVSGSATNGVDYTAIPAVITIPTGQNSVSFPIEAFEDNITEGVEEIILTATYVNACGDTSVTSVTIPIVEHVPIDLVANDLLLYCEDDSVLAFASASGGFGALSFLWSTGSTGTSAWVPGLVNGIYPVTVTDECAWSVTEEVEVISGCGIIIPNVFSPNNDGRNDRFVIQGIQNTFNTVRIYNRWGRVVFETKNYRNSWDARGLSPGTYYYEVLIDGEEKPYTGHLTILSMR